MLYRALDVVGKDGLRPAYDDDVVAKPLEQPEIMGHHDEIGALADILQRLGGFLAEGRIAGGEIPARKNARV